MTTYQFVIHGWAWNPVVCLVLGALALVYIAFFGIQKRLVSFSIALGVLAFTLMSPLNALADGYLFTAHMTQHILLLLVVPALLLLGLPGDFSLALPRWVGTPLLGWVAGVGAMWLWHAPALCNAAVSSSLIHSIQTVSLVGLGLLFWRQILAPQEDERLSPPASILYLFSACIACSVLGIIITFSPIAVCPVYMSPPAASDALLSLVRSGWGFTSERDQQIGGLLMWVPMCMLYLGAILFQIARWFSEPATPIASANK